MFEARQVDVVYQVSFSLATATLHLQKRLIFHIFYGGGQEALFDELENWQPTIRKLTSVKKLPKNVDAVIWTNLREDGIIRLLFVYRKMTIKCDKLRLQM